MTHGVLSSLPSQLPRKRKGSRTKERAGKTSLKEPKEMERVMLLVSLPSARTESVTLSDYTLDWQAGPGSPGLSENEDTNPSLVLPVVGHAPRLLVLLQGPRVRSLRCRKETV